MHPADFARHQAQQRVIAVAADDLGVGAGGARQLTALARLHLDIVDQRADRRGAQGHRVARLHIDLFAGDHHVAFFQALRRDDVGLLAVRIAD